MEMITIIAWAMGISGIVIGLYGFYKMTKNDPYPGKEVEIE